MAEKVDAVFKPVLLKDISEEKAHYEWIWENVIAKGHRTLMTALFKTGKSTFIRCLIKAIYDEEEFLGFPTKKSRILVVSEESESEWKSKGTDHGLDVDDLELWISKPPFYGKANKKSWSSFILEDLFNFCINNSIDLVIIDTVSHFWPVEHENDSGETGSALGVLDKLIDYNIAVLVVQQSNKQGGDFAKAVRGSTEIGGWPDEIIVFGRMEGENQKTRRRQINFYGRLFDLEDNLIIKLDYDNTYTAEGSKYQVSKKARLEVLHSIFLNNEKPLTIKEIREGWDDGIYGMKPSDDSLRRYLTAEIDSAKLRIVDHIITVKKKTPRYGLVGKTYLEQQTATFDPLYQGVAVSSDNNKTNRSVKSIEENVAVSKIEPSKKVLEYVKED